MADDIRYPVKFDHLTGLVRVSGDRVGVYLRADPSGAPWSRTPTFVFRADDGVVENARQRRGLEVHAVSAWSRLRKRGV